MARVTTTGIATVAAFALFTGSALAQSLGDATGEIVDESVGAMESIGDTTGDAFSQGVDAISEEDQGGDSEFDVGERGGPDCDGADANRPECDDRSPFGEDASDNQGQEANDDVFDAERDVNRND